MGIFRRQAFWAVQRRHVWLAPLIRPRGDYLNSQKRLIMLVLFLLNVTVVAALLSSDEQALPFLSSTASFAIFCVLLSFPIPFVWAQLFFRAPPPSMRVKLLKRERHDIHYSFLCLY